MKLPKPDDPWWDQGPWFVWRTRRLGWAAISGMFFGAAMAFFAMSILLALVGL